MGARSAPHVATPEPARVPGDETGLRTSWALSLAAPENAGALSGEEESREAGVVHPAGAAARFLLPPYTPRARRLGASNALFAATFLARRESLALASFVSAMLFRALLPRPLFCLDARQLVIARGASARSHVQCTCGPGPGCGSCPVHLGEERLIRARGSGRGA